MKGRTLALVGALVGCNPELPPVAPAQFACVDDQALEDDVLPCGPEHWCVEGVCTPRLGCAEEARGFIGCEPPDTAASAPGGRRCEPVETPELSAVRCESGRHTNTSTRPADPMVCACPDGLHCVAYLEGPDAAGASFSPDLRFLPRGGPAPGTEVPERRLCVRACSEEVNCPAEHTCRPALAEAPGRSLVRGDERNTIAVCYPNVLAETSSTSTVTQPLGNPCLAEDDCPDINETCRYEVEGVPDHPVAPIGQSWARQRALVARCRPRSIGGLEPNSCTNGAECLSGICFNTRCQEPCAADRGCRGRSCLSVLVERRIDANEVVVDRVSICERI